GAQPEKSELRYVTLESDRVIDRAVIKIALRFNSQVVVSGRHTGDRYRVVSAAFGPGSVRVIAVVITDLAAKVIAMAGVLVNERVIQINPIVVDVRRGAELHVRGVAGELKDVGHERRFAFYVGVELVGLRKNLAVLSYRIKRHQENRQGHQKD